MKAVSPVDIFNGITQSYQEVFGNNDGYTIETEFNGVTYEIYDRYCMNPSCKCDEVILQFEEYSENKWNGGAVFYISLSLKNNKYSINDAYHASKNLIDQVVKHSLKDSEEAIKLFKLRYKEMKGAGREALKGIISLDDERRRDKFERNAPCSCGSGKKYKKCCGA
jgi:hypothetical protein